MEETRTSTFRSPATSTSRSVAATLEIFDIPAFLADENGQILVVNHHLEKLLTSRELGRFKAGDPGILLQIAEDQETENTDVRLKGWVLLIRSGVSLPCKVREISPGQYAGTITTAPKPGKDEGLEVLLNNNQLGVLVTNTEGKILNVNPTLCRLIGYAREEILGQESGQYIAEKKDTTVESELAAYAKDGKFTVCNADRLLKHKSGHQIKTSSCVTRIKASHTEPVRFVITFIDKSVDENARHAAHESEEKLKALFVNSPDGIAVVDMKKSVITSINPAGCSVFDLGPEHIPGILKKPKSKPNKKYDELTEWMIKVAAKRNKEGVEEIKGKGGRPKYIKIYKHELYNEDDRFRVIVFDDVTEEIHIRETTIEQENQLKLFVRHIPLPIAMFDKNMNYLLVSEKWNETNENVLDQLLGKNHYDLNPNLPKRFIESHQSALKGEIVKNDLDYYIDKDGNGIYLRWEARPWYNSYNEIGGIFLISENITTQVMSDRVLKDHEIRFRSVFESGSVGWLEADISSTYKYIQDLKANGVSDIDKFLDKLDMEVLFPHFKVIKYNKQIERLFGLKEKDLLKELRLYKMIQDPENLLKRELRAIYNGEESFDTEFRIINRNGEEKFIHLSVNYPNGEDYSRVIYGVLDVTEQRKQTLQLRESEERYRTMIENNHLGVIYRNRFTKETLINDAFVDIFGYSLADVNRISEMDIMLEEYHEASKAEFDKLKNGEISSYNMEVAYYHKNGSIVCSNTTVTGLYSDKGKFYGTVTMIEDISEKKDIRQKLEEQNEELRKINEELDQFVYSAAHDLRAPIANVLGLIKLMKFEDMTETLANYVELQETSLSKLDDFIKSIVNYSQNARLELHLEDVNLKEMMTEVLDQYRYLDNAQSMDLSLDVTQEGTFRTDLKRLTIIMNNIISNAIRYSDPTKSQSYVKVKVNANDKGARLVIEDNGRGIEEDYLNKIFQLFYRADTKSKGTGIGLYLVKETVKKLNGEIKVESEHKEWTRFTIFLKNLK